MTCPRLFVVWEGIREIHLPDITGNYATLCGLSTDESASGNPCAGERINCRSCIAIWQECRKYTRHDFDRERFADAARLASTVNSESPDSKQEEKGGN